MKLIKKDTDNITSCVFQPRFAASRKKKSQARSNLFKDL